MTADSVGLLESNPGAGGTLHHCGTQHVARSFESLQQDYEYQVMMDMDGAER